jgi:hypothetical protein
MDPIGDDADEDDDHADEDHEVGGMLTQREAGRSVNGGRERVLAEVEDEPERDRRGAHLGEAGNGLTSGQAVAARTCGTVEQAGLLVSLYR